MNLFARFAQLKKKIGGNREKRQFEYTMGPEVQEQHNITMPSPAIHRMIGQLNFALQLSKRLNGKFDGEINAALTLLEKEMDAEGVLTRSACKAAEEYLLPLQDAAKEYEVIYASHAHIDMNWMWGWQETVAVTLSTFRTILNLMKEYPDFTFSQSQASVYKIVEEFDSDMMDEIKTRIREGRWEVTANAWVETDKNMPDTESLIRHIRVTRDYLKKTWGVENVKVDFSPDTFGHSRFVPEINTFGSVPYYYHCRGLQDDLTLYRYRAPSGAEVLMYKEPYWYNSGVCVENGTGVFEIEKRCAGLKTSMIVYGVGNHGGGPTRRDVERVIEMQQWPVFPKLKFGTMHEFFAKAESVRADLPVVDHELNAIFTGCYTTQSRIKLANRRAEVALLDSERMNALTHCALGTPFSSERYEKAWQKVLFTHFHDILTGSCVQESREYAMGLLADAIAHAQAEQTRNFERLSQSVDTSMFPADGPLHVLAEGAGVGYGVANYAGVPNPERGAGRTRVYTVFNTSPVRRKEMVDVMVWDYVDNIGNIEVIDHEGNVIAHQHLEATSEKYWDHYCDHVLFEADVPAMGYAVYALRQKEITDYPTLLFEQDREELPKGPVVLENDRICATFDTGSGMLKSIVDKATGEEMLAAPAGLHLIRTENAGMSAWRIGRYMGMEPVCETSRVHIDNGALRSSVTFEQQVMHSTLKMTVTLDKNADTLAYDFEIDWHEAARNQPWIPVLTYRLPLKKGSETILCDVPGGRAERLAREIDVPALTGVCAAVEGTTAALITDCKYGYRLAENVLTATLINTAKDPDPYPERGIHVIKLFVALTDGKAANLKMAAEKLIRPLVGVPTATHDGKLGPKGSLLGFEAEHSVLTSVQMSGDHALTVRLYEAEGKADEIVLQLPFVPARAVLINLNEEILGEVKVEDNKVSFSIGANKIAQVKMYR